MAESVKINFCGYEPSPEAKVILQKLANDLAKKTSEMVFDFNHKEEIDDDRA